MLVNGREGERRHDLLVSGKNTVNAVENNKRETEKWLRLNYTISLKIQNVKDEASTWTKCTWTDQHNLL